MVPSRKRSPNFAVRAATIAERFDIEPPGVRTPCDVGGNPKSWHSHRSTLASVQSFAAGDAASARSWVNASRAALAPETSGAAYVNYIDPDLADWQRAYYGRNLPRLQRVKRRYDPHNLFHFAQSIRLH